MTDSDRSSAADRPSSAPPVAGPHLWGPLAIIVAVAKNGVIGHQGRLPWHLPDDLKHFKKLTLGHTVIMGRRTWESIGRPLPGRRNVVLTQDRQLASPGVVFLPGWQEIGQLPADTPPIFVIGGASLIAEALPWAQELHLTRVHAELEGDVFLPNLDLGGWQRLTAEPHAADLQHEYAFTIEAWRRR